MGVGVGKPLGQSHQVHQPLHLRVQLFPGHPPLPLQRLPDNLADGHPGIQGGVGVLEDDLHFFPEGMEPFLVHMGHILPLVEDLASGALLKVQHGPAQGGLAAAGFPYHAQGGSLLNLEADIVHRMEIPRRRAEILFQILHF